MQPGRINTKVEKDFSFNKSQINPLAKNENQSDEKGGIILNKDLILRLSGAQDLNNVTKLKVIGIEGIKQLCNLESLVNLKYLNLSFCGIKQIEGLNKCVNLLDAILSNNKIQSLNGLQQCKQIKNIDLSYNEIKNIEGLDQLEDVQSLNLNHNQITTIKNIDSLRNLTNLSLAENKISKIDFFPKLPQIEELDISGNSLDFISPKLFENIKSLVSLNISNNKLRSIEFLNNMPQLDKFYASNNCIERVIMKSQLEDLEHLDLSKNQISETTRFDEFFPNLFSLDISSNNILKNDQLEFAEELENLCEIDFSNNLVCTPEFFQAFLKINQSLDLVNQMIIHHDSGYRFQQEMKKVHQQIQQFDDDQENLKISDYDELQKQESNEDQENTENLLNKYNISNLNTLMSDIQKDKLEYQKQIDQIMSKYNYLNQAISNNSLKQSKEQEEEEEKKEKKISDQLNIIEEKSRQEENLLQTMMVQIDDYEILEDESALQQFMTEVQDNNSQLRARYHAISGIKQFKRHNSLLQVAETTDKQAEIPIFNKSASQFKNFADSKLPSKTIIFKTKAIPVTSNPLRSSSSSLKGQSSIKIESDIRITQVKGVKNNIEALSNPQNLFLPITKDELKKKLKDMRGSITSQKQGQSSLFNTLKADNSSSSWNLNKFQQLQQSSPDLLSTNYSALFSSQLSNKLQSQQSKQIINRNQLPQIISPQTNGIDKIKSNSNGFSLSNRRKKLNLS